MAADELIDFEVIENSKENIQPLKEGRSAKALASVFSPVPSGRSNKSPTLDETKTLNDAIRAEYEIELQSIADVDDPLDIYDRYVKWTLNAYPSAQATPQSQLLPLLERATKAFLTSPDFKNDPRYLKLWLHYIRLFSDTPRETFAFLARHRIGETLALFYEEFAAWLENAGRWTQAEEVYKLGIEKEARPADRLMRKYSQFQQRLVARQPGADEPSSPALPTVRPALAAKIDPFAPATSESPQVAQGQTAAARGQTSRAGKPKMAIFSDAESTEAPPVQTPGNGWDSIGSMKDRKKENTIEAKPWTGETLKAGGRVGTGSKMEIFKDPSRINDSQKSRSSKSTSGPVNPRSGRPERVFVSMEAIYPNPNEEYSFEELRAKHRGWSQQDWRPKRASSMQSVSGNFQHTTIPVKSVEPVDVENLNESFQQNLSLVDTSTQSMVGMPPPKIKPKRSKVREVKQEVQTVKTRLESPTGRKIRRKATAEPTMTFHSKAATNDIYDMFNQPMRKATTEDTQSGEDTDYDDTYSTAGESTGTGRVSAATSEFGDDTLASVASGREYNTGSQPDSVSPWSEFTASKHLPKLDRKAKHGHSTSGDFTEEMSSSQNQTQTSALDAAFDTQAIAAIANQNFDDMDTKAIALIAGTGGDQTEEGIGLEEDTQEPEDLKTPIEDSQPEETEVQHAPRYIPIPPEDYEPTSFRSHRDPMAVAQNKLPFMTPIAEQTESSIAPSTLWKDSDYFNSKTPSRSAKHKSDSPSKLKFDELLMSSPARDSSPQSAAKRRLEHSGASDEEIITSSPRKRLAASSTKHRVEPPPAYKLSTPIVQDTVVEEKKDDVFKASRPRVQKPHQPLARLATNEPIITDLQCNPCDPSVRQQILKAIQPPITSYDGFTDKSTEVFAHATILKTYAEKLAKQKPAKFSPRKSQSDKTKAIPPLLNFSGSSRLYAVKRELGKGAFAPVYLVDSSDRSKDEVSPSTTPPGSPNKSNLATSLSSIAVSSSRQPLEALKSESPPHTLVWEFHILHLIQSRNPPSARTLHSIVNTHECHLYRDECYLLLSYSPQGTLLDLVNHFRTANVSSGKQVEGTGLDEPLVMFFAVELLRTMQSLHSIGILHGDLKADNCLVRLDTNVDLTSSYSVTGKEGWATKGLTLIDFGRAIDNTMFHPRAKFVADWDPHPEDCVEIQTCKPWKHQIDFYGAAGVIHSMLFGKYLETLPVTNSNSISTMIDDNYGVGSEEQTIRIGASAKKTYKVKEPLKRYWEKELWGEVFAVLLNKGGEEDDRLRNDELARVRKLMETYLEDEGERKGLRDTVRKAERLISMGGRR